MNKKISWKQYFKTRGLSSEIATVYIKYIKKLQENKLPIIFEIEHLSSLVGIKYEVFTTMVNGTNSFYRTFQIKKRNSKEKRTITVPYPSLKSVQKWINMEILSSQKIHPSAHGYVKNKSILTNVEPHVSQKAFLKIDLKDYFPNISINKVMKVFLDLGYSKNVSFYLASLCTLNGELPQGASTSPALSNIITKHLDNRLAKISNSYNINYTRYADDIAFSGNHIPVKFKTIVFNIIKECGFIVNERKSYLSTKRTKRILTGLSISGNKPKLQRNIKRSLKQEVFFIEKYGFFSHINKKKINNPQYLESLYGKLVFWKLVEPDSKDAIKSLKTIKEVMLALQTDS